MICNYVVPNFTIIWTAWFSQLVVQTPLVLSSAVTLAEMSPDFQCVRQLIHNLMVVFCKNNANVISAMKECADVLRQILNSPQHPTLKNWCAEIVELVTTQVVGVCWFSLNWFVRVEMCVGCRIQWVNQKWKPMSVSMTSIWMWVIILTALHTARRR